MPSIQKWVMVIQSVEEVDKFMFSHSEVFMVKLLSDTALVITQAICLAGVLLVAWPLLFIILSLALSTMDTVHY